MSKIKIGITIGDINGISPEIIIKAFSNPKIFDHCTPIVYGASKVLSYHKNIVKVPGFNFVNVKSPENVDRKKVNVINVSDQDYTIELGKATKESGTLALKSLKAAVADAKENKIDVIVTAPFNKQSMKLAGFQDVGHTEFLTNAFEKKNSLMLMVKDDLRIGTITNHIPVSEIKQKITKELILSKLTLFNDTLKADFGISKPVIALLGLNPHAGDGGLIGKEEEEVIKPAIDEAKKKHNILVTGPHPADGFFASSNYTKVDGILSMYHDQGLIPFKLLSNNAGVNFTAGLPIIRTSPDHGTAYDLAGKDMASAISFRNAIYAAIDLHTQRSIHKESHANPLKKKPGLLDKINKEDRYRKR